MFCLVQKNFAFTVIFIIFSLFTYIYIISWLLHIMRLIRDRMYLQNEYYIEILQQELTNFFAFFRREEGDKRKEDRK